VAISSCSASCWYSYITAWTGSSSTTTLAGCRDPSKRCTSPVRWSGWRGSGRGCFLGRTGDYQGWVEAFARNHELTSSGPRGGSARKRRFGAGSGRWSGGTALVCTSSARAWSKGGRSDVRSRSIEPRTRITVPCGQRSRFTHYYFYIRDKLLGPIVMRVGSFLTYWRSRSARVSLWPAHNQASSRGFSAQCA
jgi:hypothetical protein